ncbi:DUF2384 domain-containing protein [Altererythrobacter soli]|uniref:DUF2384 domain-containing protein n=1 Tax=Croceibacterium soli TaxID=1739690 RepID=A0A6I4USH4_9SPHN|nr:antitoxin Xre/MbcA/ParS toxin-binding domain-containing protein [Croceibacterium soli]MXP41862.1 DUF2384 domain-containing protein [Croceibacterium soli]
MDKATSDAAGILATIKARFGSLELAQRWFEKEPVPGFSGLTAQQLVLDGRAAEVREYIAAVDAGIHA